MFGVLLILCGEREVLISDKETYERTKYGNTLFYFDL